MAHVDPLQELASDERFAFATGSVRAREARLLDSAFTNRLVEAKDASEAWRLLHDGGFEPAAQHGVEDYETALALALQDLHAYARRVSPDPRQTDWLGGRYDFHHLKAFLKAHFLGQPPEGVLLEEGVGLVPLKVLEHAVKAQQWQALHEPLAQAGQAAFAEYEKNASLQRLDFLVDQALFRYLQGAAASRFIQGLVQGWSDLTNLRTALRVKALGKDRALLAQAWLEVGSISHGEMARLLESSAESWPEALKHTAYGPLLQAALAGGRAASRVEKLCDDWLVRYLHASRYALYGAEVLVAYVLVKELELKNVRILLVGLLNGVDKAALRARMRSLN